MAETRSEVDLDSDFSEYVQTPKKRRKNLGKNLEISKPDYETECGSRHRARGRSKIEKELRHNIALVILKDLCVMCPKEKNYTW